jgi:hypothetical protein
MPGCPPQRFCQQCRRFHELEAFEGSKRSCRHQLEQHNARRRLRASRLKPAQASANEEEAEEEARAAVGA